MEKTEQNSSSWGELIRFTIIAALIIIPIRTFIAQPFIVSGASMDPTFKDADYLIVDELSYYLRQPTRGEVVVFHPPQNQKTFYIKRIIGLPGETVTIENNVVSITSGDNTFALDEDYIEDITTPNLERVLGDKEYFVMGDNREFSADSRNWGALPEHLIKGAGTYTCITIIRIRLTTG